MSAEAARVLESSSERDTLAFGAEMGSWLASGDLVFVSGELGAGKTTLVRGAARALGVTVPVTSPTFAIAHRYPARDGLSVAHLDLYRLGALADEDPELLADYVGPELITFVEWPGDGARTLGVPRVRAELWHVDASRRRIALWV